MSEDGFTLNDIHEMVCSVDPRIEPGELDFGIMTMLLASVHLGLDVEKLHAFTGLPIKLLKPCVSRLSENYVDAYEKTAGEFAEGINLLIAVQVAKGDARLSWDDGECRVGLTEKGKHAAEKVIRDLRSEE